MKKKIKKPFSPRFKSHTEKAGLLVSDKAKEVWEDWENYLEKH